MALDKLDTLWEKVVVGNGQRSLMERVSDTEGDIKTILGTLQEQNQVLARIEGQRRFEEGREAEREKSERKRDTTNKLLLAFISIILTLIGLKLQFFPR